MNKYHILLCIYKYLDERFDKTRSEKYVFYLSNLNPYLWGDGSTADPAYFEDFMRIVNGFFEGNSCSVEDGFKYAKMYLAEYNKLEHSEFGSDIDEAENIFSECTLDDWTRIYDNLPNSLKNSG